jgi:hypothetical protein
LDTATRRAGLVEARAVERVDAATTRAATSAKFAAVLISARVVCTLGATSMGFFLEQVNQEGHVSIGYPL